MKTIEDKLFPKRNKLIPNGIDGFKATIIDVELDPIECEFQGDSTATLNTSNLSYIKLSVDNLLMLIELIEESEIKTETK